MISLDSIPDRSVAAWPPRRIGRSRSRLLAHRLAAVATSVLLSFMAMAVPAGALASSPTNDNLMSARSIESLPFDDSLNNTEATTEPGEPTWCPYVYGNHTVWYTITVDSDKVLQASLAGSSFYDHYVAVYRGTAASLGSLSRVSCATYGNPVTFKANAGVTYYLQAGDQWSSGGDLQLSVREVVPPPNDDFASSLHVTGFPFDDRVEIANATIEDGEPAGCQYGYPYQKSIWYSFTAASRGAVSFTAGGLGDIELSAYTSTGGLSGLAALQCRYQSTLTFPVEPGETYYVLARTTVSTTGQLLLTGTLTLPPSNDAFAEATRIETLPFTDVTSNAASTVEPYEPICPTGAFGTVWYSIRPSTSGSLTVRASGGYGIGPVVGVHRGSDLASLTTLGCASDWSSAVLTFAAVADSTYLIQVGASYYPVDVQLDVFPTPPPVADFGWGPQNANTFTAIWFTDTSIDPGRVGFNPARWTFGDGSSADGSIVSHTYGRDGDYTVSMTATTQDGRSATTSGVVAVRTHDIGIAKFSVPTTASSGQTRTITVGVSNHRYSEVGVVSVWKGAFPNQQLVGQLEGVTIPVQPAGRTTNFTFRYTFTAEDVAAGKVTFGAAVGIWIAGIPDAYPADNTIIATPTRIAK